MDGFKSKLMQSLQFKLSAWLCMAIIAMALMGGAFSFAIAFEEANELQDDQLKQVAALIHGHVVPLAIENNKKVQQNSDPEFHITVQIISPTGIEVLVAEQPPLALSYNVKEGIQTTVLGYQQWRIFVKTLNLHQRVVVAQLIEVRNEVAQESAIATLIPYIVLIPILLFLIGYLIREMFKPLTLLAENLDQRSVQDLYSIDENNLPTEIVPFVTAINQMLQRVEQSILQQQRFVADAAHEMRTPLTALSLQVELFEAADMSEQARERLATLKNGLERTRLLLNQLLAFARAQQGTNNQKAAVSVQHAIRSALEDLLPMAEAKHIDLGVVNDLNVKLSIQEFDLICLIKNLLDNAIRYTPEGGKIDLSLAQRQDTLILSIIDTGPGIPESERERVFDPFYRVLGNQQTGSGLGLSIVKAIAVKIGAHIQLSAASTESTGEPGLCISVEIPITRSEHWR